MVKKKDARQNVTFSLDADTAQTVVVVGEFNNWNPEADPMKPNGSRWLKRKKLTAGRYEYKFLVDRRWVTDPNNPDTCVNGFGTYNSVLTVTG